MHIETTSASAVNAQICRIQLQDPTVASRLRAVKAATLERWKVLQKVAEPTEADLQRTLNDTMLKILAEHNPHQLQYKDTPGESAYLTFWPATLQGFAKLPGCLSATVPANADVLAHGIGHSC